MHVTPGMHDSRVVYSRVAVDVEAMHGTNSLKVLTFASVRKVAVTEILPGKTCYHLVHLSSIRLL